jgi:TetR/AcrR family transcriptional repressor of lmrAB and yxaGH operons
MSAIREQILRTASELPELQGYRATGLNQIVKESGAPKGFLILLLQLLQLRGGRERAHRQGAPTSGPTRWERIAQSLAAVNDSVTAIQRFIRKIAHYAEASRYRAVGPLPTRALGTATSIERLIWAC